MAAIVALKMISINNIFASGRHLSLRKEGIKKINQKAKQTAILGVTRPRAQGRYLWAKGIARQTSVTRRKNRHGLE